MRIRPHLLPALRAPAVHSRAMDNLRYIRSTMERSVSFTALPGSAGLLLGSLAILSAALASRAGSPQGWLAIWIAAAVLGSAIGVWSIARRAREVGVSLASPSARSFALGMAPSLVAGALLTAALYRQSAYAVMPSTWMLLYGAALMTGGTFSVKLVRAMGLCFMSAGALVLLVPQSHSNLATNWAMAIVFGGCHVFFGFLIARRHDG
jgi:hypothetical protein